MKNVLILLFILSLYSYEALTRNQGFITSDIRVEMTKKWKGRFKEKSENFVLDYKYPSRLKLVSPKTTIVNYKSKLWLFTPAFAEGEKNTLKVTNSSNNLMVKLLNSLKAGLKTNKSFEVKYQKNKVQLKFIDKTFSELGILGADILPKESVNTMKNIKDVEEIILYKDKKKKDRYIFNEVEEKTFKKDHFIFETPDNTNVIKS